REARTPSPSLEGVCEAPGDRRVVAARFALAADVLEEDFVGDPQASRDLAAEIHLQQSELLEVLAREVEQSGIRQAESAAIVERACIGAARCDRDERHLAEAVARSELGEPERDPVPAALDRDASALDDEEAA